MNSRSHPTLPQLGRFTVYRKSLGCARLVLALPVSGSLREQLRRAMHSVVLNTAEGGAERSRAAKKRYLAIARASLWEVAAALDLHAIEGGQASTIEPITELLRELDAMLWAILKRP